MSHFINIEDIFYPAAPKTNQAFIDTGDGHSLYYYELGNPDGEPVIIVHGGPGGGLPDGGTYTRLHDPSFFRIIALEQRGCGRSRPHVADDMKAAIHNNNPFTLAADFEKLRLHLKIPRWHVYGYSWGSCLGTLYASLYPAAVLSLTIGGVWMHTPREIDWYFNRMGLFFPEHEEALLNILPKNIDRFDRMEFIYKAITGKDKRLALKVAEAQGFYELMACFFREPPDSFISPTDKAEKELRKLQMISLGALECTLMYQHPLKENWYGSASSKKALQSIKDFFIVQGRYDIVCPPTKAFEINSLFPHSHLRIVQRAGHSVREPDMLQAMIHANNRLKYKA